MKNILIFLAGIGVGVISTYKVISSKEQERADEEIKSVKKKYKEMCYLFPSFVLTLVCIASPVNTYFRYALPTIFAMPVMISMFFKIIRNGK